MNYLVELSCNKPHILKVIIQGTWVAQLVKRLKGDFGSGHDLMGNEIEPHVRLYAQWGVGLKFSSFPPPSTCVLSLSLSQINKYIFKKESLYSMVTFDQYMHP